MANQVGIAIWNGTLFNKVGNLWKYSSNGTNYNPCSVDSAYDIVEYNNLRCVNNYQVDSGWATNNFANIVNEDAFGTIYIWNNTKVCNAVRNSTSCVVNNSTFYKGVLIGRDDGGSQFNIKKVDNYTEYKAFSTF